MYLCWDSGCSLPFSEEDWVSELGGQRRNSYSRCLKPAGPTNEQREFGKLRTAAKAGFSLAGRKVAAGLGDWLPAASRFLPEGGCWSPAGGPTWNESHCG